MKPLRPPTPPSRSQQVATKLKRKKKEPSMVKAYIKAKAPIVIERVVITVVIIAFFVALFGATVGGIVWVVGGEAKPSIGFWKNYCIASLVALTIYTLWFTIMAVTDSFTEFKAEASGEAAPLEEWSVQ